MIRMYARRMSQRLISPGTDEVLFGMSLPSESRLNNVRAKVSVVGSDLDSLLACGYAVEGWILPVLDPDSGQSLQTLWDNLVPKDSDVQTLDLDTSAADVSPFWEPGEFDLGSFFEVGLRPERIYHKHKILTMANGSIFTFQDNQTPFNRIFVPGDNFVINVAKNYFVKQPSVVVFGFAAPAMDDTTSGEEQALQEAQWGQTKYVHHVLERAMLHTLGLTEGGAETPWEEATALLVGHLDPDVFEETSGSFDPSTFAVFTEALIDHSVVGELGKMAVTGGR